MTYKYKICDPVHGFIRFEEPVLRLIDSFPFQRLRHIRQMGVAYLIYPGANHSRFEHSLGVMELVTRIYNTLISHFKCPSSEDADYWRVILRFAALCHDLGHLPFSHTAEKALLPEGGHEQMTIKIIQSEELRPIWKSVGPKAEQDVIKLAVSENGYTLTPWERVLSQIITEDNFGADRIDYLIRDARYTGAGYGHFDYHQLIDTLRILPHGEGLSLGITADGIQSVESLWIARYMMHARVYLLPKSRAYTNHMKRYMCRHYKNGISTEVERYLAETDFVVLSSLYESARKGDEDARILCKLEKAYQEVPLTEEELQRFIPYENELQKSFGDKIFIDHFPIKKGSRNFPVLAGEGKTVSSFTLSPFLRDIPAGGKTLSLYADSALLAPLKEWMHAKGILESAV